MAEETIHSLVTSEKSESDGNSSEKTSISKPSSPDNGCSILLRNHRASTGSCHDVNNPRRISTGKPSFQKSTEKVVPHYLRASTGSCHDFCKYGRKHAFEEKERRPLRKRIIRAPSDKQKPAVTVSLVETKKATVVKQMISPDVKRITRAPSDKQNPAVTVCWGEKKKAIGPKQMVSTDVNSHLLKHRDSPGAIKLADPRKIMKQEVLLPSKKLDASPEQDELSDKKLKAEKRANNFSDTHLLKHRDSPGAIKLADPRKIMKQEVLLPSKKLDASPKQDELSDKKLKAEKRAKKFSDKRSPSVRLPLRKQSSSFYTLKSAKNAEKAEMTTNNLSQKCSPSVRPKPATAKSSKFFLTPEQINGRSKSKDDTKASKTMVATKASAKKVLASPTSSLSLKPSVNRNVALKAKKIRSLKPMSLLKDQNRTKKAEMVKPINGRSKRTDDTKASKIMVAAKAYAKKVLASPTASLSPNPSINRNVGLKAKKIRSLKRVSLLKDQNRTKKGEMVKPENEKVPEKTLRVIVTETKNDISESTEEGDVTPSLAPPSFQSPESLFQLESASLLFHEEGEGEGEGEGEDDDDYEEEEEEEGEERELEDDDDLDDEEEEGEDDENGYACEKADELISDKNGMANINEVKNVEGNQMKTRRKGVVSSESKDPTPVKLKFKRGKVVDLQSESNGPRRLRFRRGRVMEENYDRKSEIRRRNFKKKGPDGDGNGSHPSNEKVVLRHQDMQGRKDAQGLFNNVIEETASKLVESRKSKVKALVGAFETVISLQDTKPSSQTVS